MPYNLIFAAAKDPINLESGGGIGSILKLIGLIILCILIIAASYYTTKFVGKKQMKVKGKSNIRSIEVFRITTNKYLQIVEIGERYFVLAVAKDNITTVCELSKEDITNFPPESGEVKSFKECMSDIINRKKKETKEVPRFDLTEREDKPVRTDETDTDGTLNQEDEERQ